MTIAIAIVLIASGLIASFTPMRVERIKDLQKLMGLLMMRCVGIAILLVGIAMLL